MQAVTGVVSLLFVLATFYRSASLYHPQRRAILHLKSQKRKIKSKDKKEKKDSSSNNTEDTSTPPLFDLATLKSRTVQILLLATSVAAVGLNTPMLYLVIQSVLYSTPVLCIQCISYRHNKATKMGSVAKPFCGFNCIWVWLGVWAAYSLD